MGHSFHPLAWIRACGLPALITSWTEQEKSSGFVWKLQGCVHMRNSLSALEHHQSNGLIPLSVPMRKALMTTASAENIPLKKDHPTELKASPLLEIKGPWNNHSLPEEVLPPLTQDYLKKRDSAVPNCSPEEEGVPCNVSLLK